MKQYPGYTLVRTEPCPEQHGTLTLLTHDISGATVLLVKTRTPTRLLASGLVPSHRMTPACSTSWSTRCCLGRRNTRSNPRFCS